MASFKLTVWYPWKLTKWTPGRGFPFRNHHWIFMKFNVKLRGCASVLEVTSWRIHCSKFHQEEKNIVFYHVLFFPPFNFFCKPSFFLRRCFCPSFFLLPVLLPILSAWYPSPLASKPQLPTFDWPSHPDTTGAASWAPKAAGSGAALRPRRLGRAHQWGRSVGRVGVATVGSYKQTKENQRGPTMNLSLITWWISVKFQEISCFVFVRLCKSPNFGILIVTRICKVKNS